MRPGDAEKQERNSVRHQLKMREMITGQESLKTRPEHIVEKGLVGLCRGAESSEKA